MYLKDEAISLPRSNMLLTISNILGKIASAALIVPTSEALGQLKWNWFHKSKAMWDFEIFDKASRGPWGAVMLLFRTRGRSLAALGALLIVLLLAIDTFFQQVVEFPERWALESAASKLPVTVQYIPGGNKEFREWIPSANMDSDLSRIIEKFSYENGSQAVPFGNGSRPDIPLVSSRWCYCLPCHACANKVFKSCPTSKCDWPVYETLGICSQCADFSSYLKYDCLASKVDWTANTTGGFNLTKDFAIATVCGYFLNSTAAEPILMSGHVIDTNQSWANETLIMRSMPLTTLTTKEPLYGNGSLLFKHMRNTIVDVLIVSSADGTPESVHRRVPPLAQECVLSWCVKTMQSSHAFGTYTEKVVETHINTTAGSFPWIGFPFVDALGAGTDIFYLQDIEIHGSSLDGRTFSGYGTGNNTALTVIQGFNDIFPSFTTVNNTFEHPVMRYKIYKEGPAYNRVLDFNPWLAPNNISRHMERMAVAMTNIIRSGPSNAMLAGEAFSIETYVEIHWGWLSFPFMLLLLSLVFLVATMMKTSKDGDLGAWKTSAMPALIYSLPPDVQRELSISKNDNSSPRRKARKVRIRLFPERGWRVSKQFGKSPTAEIIRHPTPVA